MTQHLEKIIKATIAHTTKSPYERGFDAGVNGPNERNCHFSIFRTPENTKAWERGKAAGDAAKGRTGGIPIVTKGE